MTLGDPVLVVIHPGEEFIRADGTKFTPVVPRQNHT